MSTKKIPSKESETVEFKTSFNIETIETLVAFANAKGGCVYVGVADTGKVVGIQVAKETIPQWIIDWIERYGTGIRRIRDYFREYGSPDPLFENFQHGFRVIAYPIQITEKGTEKGTGKGTGKGTEKGNVSNNIEDVPINRLESILNLISLDDSISIPLLAENLNVNSKTIKRDIQKLKSEGKLERIGNKGGYWKILK